VSFFAEKTSFDGFLTAGYAIVYLQRCIILKETLPTKTPHLINGGGFFQLKSN